MKGFPLRDAGAADARGAHLCEHLVEPLQGAVQVQLDPAGGAGHRLSPGRGTRRAETDVEYMEKAVWSRACVSKLTKVKFQQSQTSLI